MARLCTVLKAATSTCSGSRSLRGGLFRAETVAERLPDSSLLNTVLTLYKQDRRHGAAKRVIARNDDYYGNDSYLEVQLEHRHVFHRRHERRKHGIQSGHPRQRHGGPHRGGVQPEHDAQARRGTTSMRDPPMSPSTATQMAFPAAPISSGSSRTPPRTRFTSIRRLPTRPPAFWGRSPIPTPT